MNKIAQITSSISNEMKDFEIELKKIINANDNFLKEYLCDFIFSGAKFLRPRLIFLFSKILKIEDKNILNIALTTELLHNASLIHDDIIDEAEKRRNINTFHKKFNSKIAVLEGDFLLSLALNILVETNFGILNVFSKKILKTIQGEIKQNENINKKTDLKTYFEKTFNKTANLFFAGLEALFEIKEVDEKIKKSLKNYLENFCYAFQIKNDIKDIKSDFKNGNYTLAMLYFFMENEDFKSDKDLEKYIKKAIETVEDFKEKAICSLMDIENSFYKEALIELIQNI